MPFCPQCRAEYRREFTTCVTCEGVALVDQLPEDSRLEPGEATRPVGLTPPGDQSRAVVVGDRTVDLARAFASAEAREMVGVLQQNGVPCRVVEIEDIEFPGGQTRYEVHVREGQHAEAEAVLRTWWASTTGGEGEQGVETDSCPACGAKVPLDVEECPECGLVVGVAE